MSSNTKIPSDLMSSVRSLGEWLLRNQTQTALANAPSGIWGARASQLLPALQKGLASFTQTAGLGEPDFNRFAQQVGGASASGSPPEEVREIVEGALPVAYALAGADGTTYAAFKQISDLLKIKPVQVENVPAETLGSVGQSLMVMAEDLKKITKAVAPQGKGGGTQGGKGYHAPPTFREIKPGTAIQALAAPYVGALTAQGGEGPPYSATISPPGGTIGVVQTAPQQFMLVAGRPFGGDDEATATITLFDKDRKSHSDIVVIVDFAEVEEPRDGGGKPTLRPSSSSVIDASRGSLQARELVGTGLPASFDLVVTAGDAAPTQPPPPDAQLAVGWTIDSSDADDASRGVRIKVRFAVGSYPTTAAPASIWIAIVSHGKVLASAQAHYVNPPPRAQPTGLASRWITLGPSATVEVDGTNLQSVADPHLQFISQSSPQFSIPLAPHGDSLVGSLAGATAGFYTAQLTSGESPTATSVTFPLGSVTLANAPPSPITFQSLQVESSPVQVGASQATVPANASSAAIVASAANVVAGTVAKLESTTDQDSVTYTVGKATSAASSMTLTLDAEVLAIPGTYRVVLESPQPVADASAATAGASLTVVVAPPTVTGPATGSYTTDSTSPSVIPFQGLCFLPDSTVAVTALDATGKVIDLGSQDLTATIDAAATGSLPTTGTITLLDAPSATITSLRVTVTNKANNPSSVDVTSLPFTIAMKDPPAGAGTTGQTAARATHTHAHPQAHARRRHASTKEALADDIVEIVGSPGGKAHVLELISERLEAAGYTGHAVKVFEGQLTVLRTLERHALHERVKHILATLPQ
jgi:hypothetical protein